MLARSSTHRVAHSLYLDFLAPTLLHRNQSSSSVRPRPPRKGPPKSAQSPNPSVLASQITQTVSLLTRHEGVIPPSQEIDLLNNTISRIKHALIKYDILTVWKHWTLLVDKNMLQFLGLPQLETYSRHIAGTFNEHPSGRGWSTDEQNAMQEIALFAASGGHPEALNTIMASRIDAGQPTAVLDLYRQFISKSPDAKTTEATDDLDDIDEHPSPLDSPLQYSSGRTDTLLYAITACAMQDSFHEAARIMLSANTRLNTTSVKRLLPALPIRAKVADYLDRLGVARMLGYPPVFAKHLSNLVRARRDDLLEKMYQTMLDGVLGPEPWLAAKKSDSASRPVTMPDFTWTSLITAFMTCKRPDLAEKLWDDMAKCGVKPEVSMWTAIFDGYKLSAAYQESFSTWEAMLSQGIKPEPLTYRAIIATLFNCRRPKDAMDKYREYERDWSPKRKTSASLAGDQMDSQILALHNTVLHGLFTNTDKEQEALDFFKRMQTRGPQPDVVSWNTLMGYYSRRGNLKMISSALQAMRQMGLSGDVFTYSIILSALLKAGREDAPDLIIGMMKKHGIERNATVNTAIIDQILQNPDAKRFKAAFELLTRMESEESVRAQPNEVTYTAVLAGLYRGEWQSKEELDTYRADILRRMSSRDVRPNRTTYHILFRACFDSPSRHGYQLALDHYDTMLRQKITPTFDTWWILFDGLLRKGQLQIANEMVDDMVKRWGDPSGSLVTLVDRIRKGKPYNRR